jgi:hypothetical protein
MVPFRPLGRKRLAGAECRVAMRTPHVIRTSSWKPFLDGDRATRARAFVDDVAAALRDPATEQVDPGFSAASVASGLSGAALFFGERHALTKEQADADTAFGFLDRALDLAANVEPLSVPLYTGTSGVGWSLNYLERILVEGDDEESDVDQVVAAALRQGPWISFDLIRGLAGMGAYWMERLPRPHAVEGLRQMTARLQESSSETPDGTTWWVDPASVPPERAERFPDGYYDTGLAHGQAGVLVALAGAYDAGVEEAGPLLRSATDWLLAQRGVTEGPGLYPLLKGRGEELSQGGRLAWCYGDTGVAVGLLAAARSLGDTALVETVREIAHTSTERPKDRVGVMDMGICHGAAGLALVYARLAHGLGDDALGDEVRHWVDVLLEQRDADGPIAGVWSSQPGETDDTRSIEPRAGFLEGAIGVGLVLLGLLSENAPDWDVLLLTRPTA